LVDCIQVFSRLRPGLELSVVDLPVYARCRLAGLLDPRHPDGRDWTGLASSLGLKPSSAAGPLRHTDLHGDSGTVAGGPRSPVDAVSGNSDAVDGGPLSGLDAVLDAWSTASGTATVRDLHGQRNDPVRRGCDQSERSATVRDLHGQLVKLGRTDAVESLLSLAPLYKYV